MPERSQALQSNGSGSKLQVMSWVGKREVRAGGALQRRWVSLPEKVWRQLGRLKQRWENLVLTFKSH